MEGALPPGLEASLLQRWFPTSPTGTSTLRQHERLSETDLREISDVLRRLGHGAWSRIPRIYTVLRLLDRIDVIDLFLAQTISDVYFPFTRDTLPQSLNPAVAQEFIEVQRVVLSSALDLERETGRHRHFSSANDVPFIKVEELGKGAYGYVDRVISTVSHKEYARKLIPRGRTFKRDQKILQDFERELGTLKKLRHHRHIVQLIGSYTDPRFVGIVMSPVAECDLKDFLNDCASDAQSNAHSRKSFIRSFFGCLTSALSYLHDNTVRHKDIKPQNVLVAQHTVYLTDFGISLDWSEIGQSTTTGPTPRTARYCAPEVSDFAPRNTSSDMWSLGCIFLEIWTVLKGKTVADLHAFLEADGGSSCYHLSTHATFQWMKELESEPTLADNPPKDWILRLLVEDKSKRWTARQLLSEIEIVNTNPDTKFAFSGQCCMEDLESAESVISSDGSFHDIGAVHSIAHYTQSVNQPVSSPGRSGPPETLLRGSEIQHGNVRSDSIDELSSTLIHEPETDNIPVEGITITPAEVEVALEASSNGEENALVAVGASPERQLRARWSSESALHSDQTLLKSPYDDLGRAQSTHPEVSLARLPSVESALATSKQSASVKNTSPSSENSIDSADKPEVGTDEAGTNVTGFWSTEDADDQEAPISNSLPLTTGRTPASIAIANSLPLRGNPGREEETGKIEGDMMSATASYSISGAERSITASVSANAETIPLLAPSTDDSANEPNIPRSNVTSPSNPASQRSDILSPARTSRIAYDVQDISRLEGSVIPIHVSADRHGRQKSKEEDQRPVSPLSTSSNEVRDYGRNTGPGQYATLQPQIALRDSLLPSRSPEETLVEEATKPGEGRTGHRAKSHGAETNGVVTSIDTQGRSEKQTTSATASQPPAPLVRSSRREAAQRLEPTKVLSADHSPSVPPTTLKTQNRTCGRCYERLTGQFVRACSGTFHLGCFTCADCETIVASKFFPIPGKIIGGKFLSIANPPAGHTQEVPLCETDYFRRLDLLCRACGKALRGTYITALNHKYHVEHFSCSEPECGMHFEESGSYYEHEGSVFCKRHYVQRGADVCNGCGTPIFKQFVDIVRNGQNQRWHPECFMIHKFWNVRVKNQFAEFFIERESPKQDGIDVPERIVEASVDRTEKLMSRIWSVLSTFEENAATLISDILRFTSDSAPLEALSASIYLVYKIGRFFEASDELDKMTQVKEKIEISLTRGQRLLGKKVVALFTVIKSVGDKRLGVTQELLADVTGLAHYLKLIIRNSLQSAMSLDPHDERTVISGFLNNVERIPQADIQTELQQRLRDNDYSSNRADLCTLCDTHIDGKVGQGCYWTHAQLYHIGCMNCPSCNGSPNLGFANETYPVVKCSRCNHDMMPFIHENLGPDFVILHTESLVFMHMLYVAWARLAKVLKPTADSSFLIVAEHSSQITKQQDTGEQNAERGDIASPPSCPAGWKAYWSAPAGRYLFMNLQTGVSQWESPSSNHSSDMQASSSQEIVLHKSAINEDIHKSESIRDAGDLDQAYLTLDDIPRIVAAEQIKFQKDHATSVPSEIRGTTGPSPESKYSPGSHSQERFLPWVPQPASPPPAKRDLKSWWKQFSKSNVK